MVKLPLVGGCQCGALRYEVSAAPVMVYNCHCTNCQKIGGGAFSTLSDMWRFTEMLRRGGELDGQRILSPAMLELLSRNHTGEMPNQVFKYLFAEKHWQQCPAYLGLGFWGRGEKPTPGPFGDLNSPRTFGGIGRGTTLFWVDPARDISLVLLSTGLMDEADNFVRYQTLADLVISSLVV